LQRHAELTESMPTGGDAVALGRTAPAGEPHAVTAEVVDAARFAALRPAWLDLVARAAEPNAFMDPALLAATAQTGPEVAIRVLLAWHPGEAGADRRLAGVWAFALDRPRKSPLPLRMLVAPAHVHGHLATPVLDRDCLDGALRAMLDAVCADAQCPKIIALEAMAADGPTMAALTRVLVSRGACHACSSGRNGRSWCPVSTAKPISRTRSRPAAARSCASTGGGSPKRARSCA
jgi:hypothetical protein